MRRLVLISLAGLMLLIPAGAQARSVTVRGGSVTATLSYHEHAGQKTPVRLSIRSGRVVQYDAPVSEAACKPFSCMLGRHPLKVVDLYGDGQAQVVLRIYTGGANCCQVDQVFGHSAAMGQFVPVATHNFGVAGESIVRVGGRWLFDSADNAFECEFSDCADSALPLQLWQLSNGAIVDVTSAHRGLVARDAARWLEAYRRAGTQDLHESLIAAYAADESRLGRQRRLTRMLAAQVARGHLSDDFVHALDRFLAAHGYPPTPRR